MPPVTQDDSRAARPPRAIGDVPPYLIVLIVASLAGVALLHHASGTWHEASQAQSFPAEIRRQLVFAVLFNAGLAIALAAVALGEAALLVVRLVRKAPRAPALVRFACALLTCAALPLGHALVNPWVAQLARAARQAMG